MARYVAYICGGDFRESTEPDNTCPNRAEHTYGPAGYVDWFSWASKLGNSRHRQSKCSGCDRYLIWTPKPYATAPPALPVDADTAPTSPSGAEPSTPTPTG